MSHPPELPRSYDPKLVIPETELPRSDRDNPFVPRDAEMSAFRRWSLSDKGVITMLIVATSLLFGVAWWLS